MQETARRSAVGASGNGDREALRRNAEAAMAEGGQRASEVARQAADAVSGVLGQAEAQLKGTGAEGYVSKAREMVDKNPVAAVTAWAVLQRAAGTRGGREVTGSLVRLGGLAAIGGLAYKAVRNYQEGKALTSACRVSISSAHRRKARATSRRRKPTTARC